MSAVPLIAVVGAVLVLLLVGLLVRRVLVVLGVLFLVVLAAAVVYLRFSGFSMSSSVAVPEGLEESDVDAVVAAATAPENLQELLRSTRSEGRLSPEEAASMVRVRTRLGAGKRSVTVKLSARNTWRWKAKAAGRLSRMLVKDIDRRLDEKAEEVAARKAAEAAKAAEREAPDPGSDREKAPAAAGEGDSPR